MPKKLPLIFLLLLLSSCSKLNLLLEREQEGEPQTKQAEVTANETKPKAQTTKDFGATKSPAVKAKPSMVELSTVELVWQAPSDEVLRYHILHGTEEDKLYNKTIVSVDELTRSTDPSLGAIYTFPLKGVPANKTVYFSIKAENQNGLSESSDILKIVPEN